MPEYLHPGVYVEEIASGPKPIEGVSTSTAAFIGETERGSTTPRVITSYGDYRRWFGGVFGDTQFMPYAINGFFDNGGTRMVVCRVANAAATPAEAVFDNFTLRAVGAGSWGRRVYFTIGDSSTKKADANGNAVAVGFRLMLGYFSAPPAPNELAWFDDPNSMPSPSCCEIFDDLETDPDSPNYWEKRLRGNSALVELLLNNDTLATERPQNTSQPIPLTGGSDGAPNLDIADFEGKIIPPRIDLQGLAAIELDAYRDIALVYAPGAAVAVNQKIIEHCERLRFRFAVVDADRNMANDFLPRTAIADTKYAALYSPWIVIADPQSGVRKIVPPGGHVLGVYARVDAQRGVFKAPANEMLRGVIELTASIDDSRQDTWNERGINAIRQFPGRGIRVWGARTLSSDALWKYVSVRRFFIFLERSIVEGTQWAAFEPNDEKLWARVVDTIRLFLLTQWRAGALLGSTEKEAFFITCDRSTMTQSDILGGRLICEIGIAPVRPAEFVVFRIMQNTAEAQTL